MEKEISAESSPNTVLLKGELEIEKERDVKAAAGTEMETIRSLPVGVIDSGVGGISVLRELVRQLPGEDFLFFGDCINAPYGTKSREWICRTVLAHTARLYERGIKALVVACNTATSAAIRELRAEYPQMPVIGIEPALKPAVMVKEHPHVLVLATPGTVTGEKFQNLMHGFEEQATVSALPCPGLMEYVEAGQLDSPQLFTYLEELLRPYSQEEQRPDAVVLGCTHYPFIRGAISRVLGGDVPVLDGSEGTARETRRRLIRAGLLRSREEGGKVTIETSLPGKELLCRQLLQGQDFLEQHSGK